MPPGKSLTASQREIKVQLSTRVQPGTKFALKELYKDAMALPDAKEESYAVWLEREILRARIEELRPKIAPRPVKPKRRRAPKPAVVSDGENQGS